MTFAFNLPGVKFPFSILYTCCCVGTSENQPRRTTESSGGPHSATIHNQCLGYIKNQISAFNCNDNGVSYVNSERINFPIQLLLSMIDSGVQFQNDRL